MSFFDKILEKLAMRGTATALAARAAGPASAPPGTVTAAPAATAAASGGKVPANLLD